jgi:hypothetical protein
VFCQSYILVTKREKLSSPKENTAGRVTVCGIVADVSSWNGHVVVDLSTLHSVYL